MKDAIYGEGKTATSFLIRKGEINFSDAELQEELNVMYVENRIDKELFNSMSNILQNNSDGNQRITTFLNKKRRFELFEYFE